MIGEIASLRTADTKVYELTSWIQRTKYYLVPVHCYNEETGSYGEVLQDGETPVYSEIQPRRARRRPCLLWKKGCTKITVKAKRSKKAAGCQRDVISIIDQNETICANYSYDAWGKCL